MSPAANKSDVTRRDLEVFFKPRSVAAIGATDREGHVGRSVLWNLISSPFGGTVYPVNTKKNSVLGIKAYPDVASLPEAPELAVIMTPAETVPGVVEECARAGVRGVVIISAGFREAGAAGRNWSARFCGGAARKNAHHRPQLPGRHEPAHRTERHFRARHRAPRQRGVHQPKRRPVHRDPRLEPARAGGLQRVHLGRLHAGRGLGRPDRLPGQRSRTPAASSSTWNRSATRARFLSAAREVALNKPIIVIKAGRTEQAAKAAASHTGSLAGSDEVLEAAFRRVRRAARRTASPTCSTWPKCWLKQPRPKGPSLTIVTNAGGPGVLATDALLAAGGELAELSPDTTEALNKVLAAALEPQQSDRHYRRRRPGALRQGGRNRGPGSNATACW